MTPIEAGGRVTTCGRILVLIKDQKPTEVGRYAGWGTEEDAHEPAGKGERSGPAMAPFLRHMASDRWWKVGIGLAYLPAIIVVITVEDWMHLSQSVMWISLGVFYVLFMATVYWTSIARR